MITWLTRRALTRTDNRAVDCLRPRCQRTTSFAQHYQTRTCFIIRDFEVVRSYERTWKVTAKRLSFTVLQIMLQYAATIATQIATQ